MQPFNGLWGLLARTQYGDMYGPRGAQFVQARLQGRTLTSWEMAPKVGHAIKNAVMTLFTGGKGNGEQGKDKDKKRNEEQAKSRWDKVKDGWKFLFGGKEDKGKGKRKRD